MRLSSIPLQCSRCRPSDTLRVDGNGGDAVTTQVGGWTQGADTIIGGEIYAEYTKGGATLQVDVDVDRGGINGFQISGDAKSDLFGQSVSDAGDVNGDGFADLIMSARTPTRTALLMPARAAWCSGRPRALPPSSNSRR